MRAVAVTALRSIPFLLLALAIAGWSAVGQSVDAALQEQPAHERIFVESHASGMRTVLGFAVPLQVCVAVLAWWLGWAVRTGRRWSTAPAVVAPWAAVCCGGGALTVDPRTKFLWSGDPDGDSIAADHFPGWYWPVTTTLVTLIVLCCLTATVLLIADRVAERRRP